MLGPVAITVTMAAARGAQWDLVFDHRGHRVYLEPSSVELGAIVRARLRFEFPGPVPARDGWPSYLSSLELRQFDCARRASGIEHSIVFPRRGLRGEALRAVEMKSVTLEQPAAGTIGAAVITAVCLRIVPR